MARLQLSHRHIVRMGSALRRASSILRWAGLVAFALLIVQLLLIPKARIVTLEARTEGVTLEFRGERQEWKVTGAGLCKPGQPAPCLPVPIDTLRWQDGTRIEMTRPPGLGLVILETQNDQMSDLPKGTRLEFDDAEFRDNGQQIFRGIATLGTQPGSGRKGYLWSASYKFFERDTFAIFTGSSSAPVGEGQLTQGDEISVVCVSRSGGCGEPREQSQMLVLGHVVLGSDSSSRPGFDIALTSAKGDVALRVSRYGVGDVGEEQDEIRSNDAEGWWPFGWSSEANGLLEIRPSWVDTVLTNPTFLALTVLLTFSASLLQTAILPGPPEKKPKAGGKYKVPRRKPPARVIRRR